MRLDELNSASTTLGLTGQGQARCPYQPETQASEPVARTCYRVHSLAHQACSSVRSREPLAVRLSPMLLRGAARDCNVSRSPYGRKRYFHRTKSEFVCLLLLALLALGCEKRPPRFAEDLKHRKQPTTDATDAGETGSPNDKSPSTQANSAPIPIVSAAVRKSAITSTVRLTVEPEVGKPRDDTGFGSGVVVGRDKAGVVYVLTVCHAAIHGIRSAEFFDENKQPIATYSSPEVVSQSVERDLALLKIKTNSTHPITIVDLVGDTNTKPKYGYSAGCGSGKPPEVLAERIIDDGVFSFKGSQTRGRMWVTDLPQEEGRSGGALFDSDGNLLGIASKATLEGYYCHAEEIRTYLGTSKPWED